MDESLAAPSESKLPLVLAGLALVGAILAAIVAFSAKGTAGKFETQLNSSADQVSASKSTIDALRQTVSSRDADIATLRQDVEGLKQEIGRLEAATRLGFKQVEESFGRINTTRAPGSTRTTTTGGTTTTQQPIAPGAGGEYAVQAGDNPTVIARKHGVTVSALLAANPGLNPSRLQVGQKINIPARN